MNCNSEYIINLNNGCSPFNEVMFACARRLIQIIVCALHTKIICNSVVFILVTP